MPENHALITSRSGFHDALRAAFAAAAEYGAREIFLNDPDFADWPLSDSGVLDSLTRWARARRRLTLLADSFDELARRQLRWVEWRRRWTHVVECRSPVEFESAQLPSLLLVPGLICVRLVDRVHYRGSVSQAPADAILAREQLDAVLQRSIEAFPVTTLGL